MSISKLPSGRWSVRLDDPRPVEGKRIRLRLGTFSRKSDAEAAERAAKIRLERGEALTASAITLADLYERYRADALSRGLSGTTLHGYGQLWAKCAPIAGIPLANLKPNDLATLYGSLRKNGSQARGARSAGGPLSARTVVHVHELVRAMLGWAVRLEIVHRNVATLVEPPKQSRKAAVPYDREQARMLIECAARTRWGPLVVVGLTTALRRGELAGLRWADINLGRRTATICGAVAYVPGRPCWYKPTKTDSIKTIALADLTIAAFEAQRDIQAQDRIEARGRYHDDGFVFASAMGGMPSPNALGDAIRKIAGNAGLSVAGMHAMRHAVATWLLRAGVDVRTVSAVLRHSAPSITLNVYGHEVAGAQEAAVGELDRLLGAEPAAHLGTMEKRKALPSKASDG